MSEGRGGLLVGPSEQPVQEGNFNESGLVDEVVEKAGLSQVEIVV
jgi:hypothetical protein